MITHLHIENFKCLRDVTIDLGLFTVLVGPNDSGKSSILDAIHLLSRTARSALSESLGEASSDDASPFASLVWHRDLARRISLDVKGAGETAYHIEIGHDGRVHRESLSGAAGISLNVAGDAGPSAAFKVAPSDISVTMKEDSTALRSALLDIARDKPEIAEVARVFSASSKYRLDSGALRRPSPLSAKPHLSPSGDNLAAVLDALLTGPDRQAVLAIEDALQKAVPTLSGIALRTLVQSSGQVMKSLELCLAGSSRTPVTIPAAQASEGALLLLGFLALAHTRTSDILLLEEPENGLHPLGIRVLVDIFRKMSTGEIGGRPRQIIVATHSPIFLNYLSPAEVRIVRRNPERGTQVTPMASVPSIDHLLYAVRLGEVWSLLLEDGLLQDTPA